MAMQYYQLFSLQAKGFIFLTNKINLQLITKARRELVYLRLESQLLLQTPGCATECL